MLTALSPSSQMSSTAEAAAEAASPAPPDPSSSTTPVAAANSSSSRGNTALNAPHLERRRQKRKYAIKKLEKKMEQYHRQIKKLVAYYG